MNVRSGLKGRVLCMCVCMFDFHVNFGTGGTTHLSIRIFFFVFRPFLHLISTKERDNIEKRQRKFSMSSIMMTIDLTCSSSSSSFRNCQSIFDLIFFRKSYYENSCEFYIVITRRWYRFLLLAVGKRFTRRRSKTH